MERDPQAEPVTLDYAPVRNARRWCVIDIALVTLAILILFALAANMTPSFICFTPPNSTSLTRVKLYSLSSTFSLYHLHLGAYPTSLDDLLNAPDEEAGAKWRGPYVEDAGTLKDAWGRPLRYKSPGVKNPGQYDLWSTGPDGVDGTADDIKNW